MTPRQRKLFIESYKAGYKAARRKQLNENPIAAAGVWAARLIGPQLIKMAAKKLALNPKAIQTATQALQVFEKMLPYIQQFINSSPQAKQNPEQAEEQAKQEFIKQLPPNVQQQIQAQQ